MACWAATRDAGAEAGDRGAVAQGAGALELAYRQLCDKLRREGLFEPGRKRRIPRVPLRVVVMTSRTGDVLHDVLTTAQRRFGRVPMAAAAEEREVDNRFLPPQGRPVTPAEGQAVVVAEAG